jgi:outer membrane beta-barrel protein
MENRNQCILLATVLLGLGAGHAFSAESSEAEQVINPDVERRVIKRSAIDTEDFEIGPYAGIISIQDFESEIVYGVRAAWHVTEDFFFEANYGVSEGDLTSYEKLSGGAPLFDDADRDYSYYNLNLGWNAFPGEVFIFDDYALKSDLYFIAGAGQSRRQWRQCNQQGKYQVFHVVCSLVVQGPLEKEGHAGGPFNIVDSLFRAEGVAVVNVIANVHPPGKPVI